MATVTNTIDEQEQDQIDALPDEILLHILSFTTTKSAVATSILSRRWRHLWKYINTIHFDCFLYRPLGAIDYSFVDQTLDHLRAPQLHKFIIAATVRGDLYANLVQKWADFALERSVEVLILDFKTSPLPDVCFDLPSSFYEQQTQSLKTITLGCAHLERPPLSFQGFVSLKALLLRRCRLKDEIVHELVLKCKLPESLTIEKCRTLKNVRIFGPSDMRLRHFTFVWKGQERVMVKVDAPNLVSLKYCGSLRMICLGSLPCLLEAKLFHDSSAIDVGFARSMLDDKLSQVELLGVDYWFLKLLAMEHFTNSERWTASKNLKNFSWFGPLNKEYDLANLLAFLADCPSLEGIKIYSRDYDRDGITKTQYTYGFKDVFVKLEEGKLEPSIGSLQHLREVGFYYFSGYGSEMEIIKRLLQRAVVLESLTVTFEELDKDGFALKKELYQEEIASLPRASSRARILWRTIRDGQKGRGLLKNIRF